MTLYGNVLSVDTRPLGSTTTVPAAAGDTSLVVGDVFDFDPNGGTLRIGEAVLPYLATLPAEDEDADSSVLLDTELPGPVDAETMILVEPYGEQRVALLSLDDEGDALEVTVPHALSAVLSDGVRDPDNRETVSLEETSPGVWAMVDVIGRRAELTATVTEPLGSDGLAPAASPTPEVLGGIGAVFVRWPGIENADPVTYDVHVSATDGFVPTAPDDIGPGDPVIQDDFDALTAWTPTQTNPGLAEPIEVPTILDGRAVIPGGYRLTRTALFGLTESAATFQIDASNLDASFDSPTRTKTGTDATALVARLVSGATTLVGQFNLDDGSVVSYDTDPATNLQYGQWTEEITHLRWKHNHGGTRVVLQTSTDGLYWVDQASWSADRIDPVAVQLSMEVRNFDTDTDQTQAPYVTLDYFEVAPNVNGVSTLATNTAATSTTIRKLPDGTDFAYDTPYYVRVVARDIDGKAPPSDQASGQLIRVNSPDIAAEYVYAGQLLADQITGGTIQSDVLLSGSIRTAASGARVEMTAFGLLIYGPDGTPTTQLGSDGQSTFKGQVQATTLTVTGGMAIRGGLNELSKAGILKLAAATQNSPNAPTVVCDYPRIQLLEAGQPYTNHVFRSVQKVGSDYWVAVRDADKDRMIVRKFNASGTFFSYLNQRDNLGLGQFATMPGSQWGLCVRDGEPTLKVHRMTYSTPQFNDTMNGLTNWDTAGVVSSSGGAAVLSRSGNGSTSITSKVAYNLRSRTLFQNVTVPPLTAYQTFTIAARYDSTHRIEIEFAYSTPTTLKATLRTVNGSTVKTATVASGLAQNINLGTYIDVHGSYARGWIVGQANPSAKLVHGLTAAQLQSMKIVTTLADTASDNTGNLISNYSFESGISGWEAEYPWMEIVDSTSAPHTGTHSLGIRNLESDTNGLVARLKASSKKAVTPGQRYEIAYWIKAATSGATVGADALFRIAGYDSAGNSVSSLGTLAWPDDGDETITTGWTRKSSTLTIPNDVAYMIFGPRIATAPGNSVYHVDDVFIGEATGQTISARVGDVVVDWIDGDIDLGSRINTSQAPAISAHDDGSFFLVAEYDTAAQEIVLRYFDPEAPDVQSGADVRMPAPSGFTGPISSILRGSYDFGALRTVVKEVGNRDYLVYNGTALVASNQFPADAGGSVGATWSASDGGFVSLGSNGYLYFHTGPTNGLSTATGPWSAAFTWYDGDTTGGTHETQASPRAQFTMQKRSRITITSPDIPDNGGTDDPDRIRAYVAQSASGTLYLQGTTAAGSQSFQTSVAAFSGTTPPVSSNFPGEAPATIVNEAATLAISGDGSIKGTTLEASTGIKVAGVDVGRSVLSKAMVMIDWFATPGQLNGTEDADPAITAAFTALNAISPRGGLITVSPGSQLRLNSYVTIPAGSRNIVLDLAGSTVWKKNGAATYVFLLARGAVGYGKTVNGLRIRNGYFTGTFVTGSETPMCVLGANHASRVLVENCEFVGIHTQSHHTFDLGGCDGVTLRDCIWRGFKPTTGSNPRTEAVNIDVSSANSGADVSPYLDGLATRNVTMDNCQFLPWTEGATTYPSGNPMGSHLASERSIFENINITKLRVVDPPVDSTTDSMSVDNPVLHGLVHFPGVRKFHLDGEVVVTNGAGSVRVVQLQSVDNGLTAAADPNVGGSGTFATPLAATGIDIDLRVVGMAGTQSTVNPHILISGLASTPARDVRIKLSTDGAYKDAIYMRNVVDASVDFPQCNYADAALRATNCSRLRETGTFYGTRLVLAGVTVDVVASNIVANATAGAAGIFSATTGSSIIVNNLISSGYTKIYAALPATHAEGVTIPTIGTGTGQIPLS